MTEFSRALYRFLGGFGLPAYARGNVPHDARPPYITCDLRRPAPFESCPLRVWIWFRGDGYGPAFDACRRLSAAVGRGVTLPVGEGCAALFPDGVSFAQTLPDADDGLRAVCVSLVLRAFF